MSCTCQKCNPFHGMSGADAVAMYKRALEYAKTIPVVDLPSDVVSVWLATSEPHYLELKDTETGDIVLNTWTGGTSDITSLIVHGDYEARLEEEAVGTVLRFYRRRP